MPPIDPNTTVFRPNIYSIPYGDGPALDDAPIPPGRFSLDGSNKSHEFKPTSVSEIFTNYNINIFGDNNTVDVTTGYKNDIVKHFGNNNIGAINLAFGDDVFEFKAYNTSNNDLTIDGGVGNDSLTLGNWALNHHGQGQGEGGGGGVNHSFTIDQIKSTLLPDGSYELLMPDNNRLVLKNMEKVSYFDPHALPPVHDPNGGDPAETDEPWQGKYVTLTLAEFIAKTQH